MMNKQKYLPYGLDTENSMVTEEEFQKAINETTLISCRVIMYDMTCDAIVLKLFDNKLGILEGCTLSSGSKRSLVGNTISIVPTDKYSNDGKIICLPDPNASKARRAILEEYEVGTELIGRIELILGYAVMVDIGLGNCFILHSRKIKEVYPDIKNPSEVFVKNQFIRVFLCKGENGISLSLKRSEATGLKGFFARSIKGINLPFI